MQHFLEPHVEKDTWLTAFLNLPVEEEVTIKGGSKKIIYVYTVQTTPQQYQQPMQKVRRSATATQVMHEITTHRYPLAFS